MSCEKHNDGTIIAAHSNQLRDGKGTGIKAHDFRIAFICNLCHDLIDKGKLPRQDKIDLWENAHRKTMGYLFESGIIKV